MKKHIQIKNSFNIWKPSTMTRIIKIQSFHKGIPDVIVTKALLVEWWIHNIAYWLTKPFTFIPALKRLNLRAKDVDLMV